MPFSDVSAALPRVLYAAMLAVVMSGCGSESPGVSSTSPNQPVQDNSNVDASAPITIKLDVNSGGYVTNVTATLYCGDGGTECETQEQHAYTEYMGAIARFGSKFDGWIDDATSNSSRSFLVTKDITPQAAFSEIATAAGVDVSCAATNSGFKSLHMGDSLTAGLVFGTASHGLALMPAAINYYEKKASSDIDAPVVVAAAGIRSSGQFVKSPTPASATAAGLPADHFWQQNLDVLLLAPDDFTAAVVALGSNDLPDMLAGMSADTIIAQRIKPLLEWLGDRPVFWILPHYAQWPTAMQSIRFSATAEGLDCACETGTGHDSTQCNIVSEMQSCNVDQTLQRKTIDTFHAIHSLRQRLVALQDEYPNLIVIDPAQTISAASNSQYDLYATMTMTVDTIHFSPQGAEWYAWLHAWSALHANPDCGMPAMQKWQMGNAETAMATELDAFQ